MILGGAAGIIAGVIAVLGAGVLAAALGEAASFALLMAASIAAWAAGVTGLIAGLCGVQNAVKPENKMTCVVFGILTVALSAMGSVLALSGGGNLRVMNLIAGLMLPVLYLLGALRRKGSDKAGAGARNKGKQK